MVCVIAFCALEVNEVATAQKIRGAAVQISGTVKSIDKDYGDHAVLRFIVGDEFDSLSTELLDSQKDAAGHLSRACPRSGASRTRPSFVRRAHSPLSLLCMAGSTLSPSCSPWRARIGPFSGTASIETVAPRGGLPSRCHHRPL